MWSGEMTIDHFLLAWTDKFNERHYEDFENVFGAFGAALTVRCERTNTHIVLNGYNDLSLEPVVLVETGEEI
jgi:hypothetical protein